MKKKTDGMLALFFSFFFFLWFLILCREPKGDTVRFLQFLEQTPPLELLRERLASETTRVILEAILFFFLQRHWLLFALANAAVTALAIRLLGRLSDRLGRACALPASEERAPLLLMTFLFFLYPLEDLAAAGIPPTFINYVWPSAFGLLALWPVAYLLAGKRERIPAPWLAASPVLILIAGNMEQMAAILTGVLTGAAGYYAARHYAVRQLAPGNGSAGGAENGADRKARRDSLAALLFLDMLAALSLLFHLQGGNAARMELSIRTYWPGAGKAGKRRVFDDEPPALDPQSDRAERGVFTVSAGGNRPGEEPPSQGGGNASVSVGASGAGAEGGRGPHGEAAAFLAKRGG